IFPSVSDLLDLRTVHATLTLGPCAEVRVGEHVIRYVRRGSGPYVVLLGADESNRFWSSLVDTLGSHHRLVVPQLPSAEVDTTSWLRGLIEGLGIASCTLIAGSLFSDTAIELLTSADPSVNRIVVLDTANVSVSEPRVLRIDSA